MALGPYNNLLLDLSEEGILTVTLNRPERLNALTIEMHHEIEHFLTHVDDEPDVKVIILTGAGRGFCAGGDWSPPADASEEEGVDPAKTFEVGSIFNWLPARGHVVRMVRGFVELSKPIIAAVNGPAAAIGAQMALLCDVVFMSEDARIGDRHTRMGITAGDGGAVIWPLLCGVNRAKEILMTGEMIGAQEAYRLGLVNHVVPADKLMDEARAYAKKLLSIPYNGVCTTKVLVNKITEFIMTLNGGLGAELEARCFASGEMLEPAKKFRAGIGRG